MKLIIEIPEEAKQAFDCAERNDLKGGYYDHGGVIGNAIKNGTPIPDNATNGQVLFQMFPPSVYYGDDEKHIVLLTKDCELTCYNNDWWNAPYERKIDEQMQI